MAWAGDELAVNAVVLIPSMFLVLFFNFAFVFMFYYNLYLFPSSSLLYFLRFFLTDPNIFIVVSFPFSFFCSFVLPIYSLSFSFSSFLPHILHCQFFSPSQFGVVSSFRQFLPQGSNVAV